MSRAGLTLLLLIALPRLAAAHEVGISGGEYRFDGTKVRAKLTFSRAEEELKLDTHGLGITVQGREPCPLISHSSHEIEKDGLEVELRFECVTSPEVYRVHLGFLDRLDGHRHYVDAEASGSKLELVAYRRHPDFEIAPGRTVSASSSFDFLYLGFEHILIGYDHLLFLLGLIIVGGRLKQWLLLATAFTIAHSLTLGAAALGLVRPSSAWVEPMIALSVAYVGAENLWLGHAPKYRWVLTFAFGLVHGFGFAGVLAQIGLPEGRTLGALLFFNLGVELGQILVLLVLLPAVLWMRRGRYASKLSRGVSVGVLCAGLFWFVRRAFF